VFWQRLGGKTAIISGRTSKAVDIRAAELGISLVIQGSIDKRADLGRVLKTTGCGASETCAIGDDCRICDVACERFGGGSRPMPAPK